MSSVTCPYLIATKALQGFYQSILFSLWIQYWRFLAIRCCMLSAKNHNSKHIFCTWPIFDCNFAALLGFYQSFLFSLWIQYFISTLVVSWEIARSRYNMIGTLIPCQIMRKFIVCTIWLVQFKTSSVCKRSSGKCTLMSFFSRTSHVHSSHARLPYPHWELSAPPLYRFMINAAIYLIYCISFDCLLFLLHTNTREMQLI